MYHTAGFTHCKRHNSIFEDCLSIWEQVGEPYLDVTNALEDDGKFFNVKEKQYNRDFPGGTVVENLPASAGDTGSSPGPGRSHMLQSN